MTAQFVQYKQQSLTYSYSSLRSDSRNKRMWRHTNFLVFTVVTSHRLCTKAHMVA